LRLDSNSSAEKDFCFTSLIYFSTIWIGLADLSKPRIATRSLEGEDHRPPIILPLWKSWSWVSDGSNDKKEIPFFSEISSKELINGIEGPTATLIVDKWTLE
jgi:hypothetical protein